MNSQIIPLRYKISNIDQLPKCKSNNSRHLHIRVTEFGANQKLQGTRISVEHDMYGTLFSYILDAEGAIVSELEDYDSLDISMQQILAQFERFGFLIEYDPSFHLPQAQLDYLITLQGLGYDKIRILSIWTLVNNVQSFELRVVAFQVDPLGDWLNNGYSPSRSEYVTALDTGTAINLTDISKTKDFRWDWLKGKVLSIQDIIDDNHPVDTEEG